MNNLPFALAFALTITACGGGTTADSGAATGSAAPAQTAEAATTGAPQLHLFVSGETGTASRGNIMDGTAVRVPSCMVDTIVENRGDAPLTLFSAHFKPTHAETREPLETTLSRVVVPHLSAEKPLAPGGRSQPSKINVIGASCDQVQFTVEPISCFFLGDPCRAVSGQQAGLAGLSPLRVAPGR